jgi:hypothetical protein
LVEGGRIVHQPAAWDGPERALEALRQQYRRDRTEGQRTQIILGVEKAGVVAQLRSWFDHLGVPILATGGYSSVTLETKLDELADTTDFVEHVLIYAGDFDPTGEDIVRNLERYLPSFTIEQIALTPAQVRRYDLPENTGKESDPRSAGFVAKHGRLVQVELDALDPDVLRGLYQEAIDQYWDGDAYGASLAREAEDRAAL